MKSCTACNQQIPSEAKFCPECGAKQEVEVIKEVEKAKEIQQVQESSEVSSQSKLMPKFLVVTTVLAIAFSASIGLLGLSYLFFGDTLHKDATFYMGIAWVVVSIATIIGAALMIRRLKKGFYLYMISQVILIISIVIEIMLSYEEPKSQTLVVPLTLFLLIPAITFVVIFSVSKFQKHLH